MLTITIAKVRRFSEQTKDYSKNLGRDKQKKHAWCWTCLERTPVSAAFVHLHPPRSRTRVSLRLTPVSSFLCHPYLPLAVTRIYLGLSLVISLDDTTVRSVRWCLRDGRRCGWVIMEDAACCNWKTPVFSALFFSFFTFSWKKLPKDLVSI